MSEVNFYSEDVKFQLENQSNFVNWIESSIQNESLNTGEISIVFTSDDYLLKVNQDTLNHDYYTDIITFDYCVDKIVNGDLFISIDRVMDNARHFDVTFEDELSRVIIHGVLHLCGYKDKSEVEKRTMREKENFYLSLHSKN